MAKKSMKEAATAGTSVFGQIASGNIQDAENVTDAQDAQNVQDAKSAENVTDAQDAENVTDAQNIQDTKNTKDVNKKGEPLKRLNLKIPAEIKEYLTVAAAKASIEQRRNISLTEYLIQIVRDDMAKNNE